LHTVITDKVSRVSIATKPLVKHPSLQAKKLPRTPRATSSERYRPERVTEKTRSEQLSRLAAQRECAQSVKRASRLAGRTRPRYGRRVTFIKSSTDLVAFSGTTARRRGSYSSVAAWERRPESSSLLGVALRRAAHAPRSPRSRG